MRERLDLRMIALLNEVRHVEGGDGKRRKGM